MYIVICPPALKAAVFAAERSPFLPARIVATWVGVGDRDVSRPSNKHNIPRAKRVRGEISKMGLRKRIG